MDGAGTRIVSGMRAAFAFTSEAWRDAWAPLGALAAGQALTFVAGHAGLQTTLAGRLQLAGWAVSALALLPALGALYRSAVGGKRAKEIERGGLQFGGAEWRVVVTTIAMGVCLFLALAATGAVALAARVALGGAGVMRLPVLGPFAVWFVAVAPVLVLMAAFAYAFLSRLSLAYPAAVADGWVNFGRALRFSRRWKGSLAATLLLTELVPTALVIGLARSLEALERGWAQSAGVTAWPLLDATAAGSVLALATAFVVVPLGVGARTHFYARGLAEERAAQRRRAPIEAAAREALEPTEVDQAAEESNVVELPPPPPPVPTLEESLAALQAKLEEAAERVEAAGGARVYADGWRPPVAPLRASDLSQPITAPVLLTHANDRIPDPRWWSAPEHPEEPPVA